MDDSSFGPRLSGQFDFTLLFEHAFLHIVPSIFMLLTVPYYIYKIFKGPVLVRPGILLWAKLGAAVAIAAIQLTSVVLWYKSPLNSPAAQAASILSFLSSLGIIVIGYSSHTHFFQPIFFLAFYLIVTLLFDLVTVYSYWRRDSLHAIARLACALPPLKLALIALEEISKRSLIISKEARDACTNEAMAGFWNRSTFAWVNPLLLFGFRNRIKNNHLPDIGVQFDAETKYYAFKQLWDKQDKKDKYALLKACVYSDPWPYVYIVLPRLFLVGFLFSEPFLLQDVVNTVSGGSHDDFSPEKKRTSLILATGLVFIGKAIAQNCYSHIRNQIMVSIRGVLVTAIYKKSLTISATEVEELAAITLMSADVNGIERLISLCYDSWALVLETGCGIAILSVFVGAASIFTVIMATAVAVVSKHMAKKISLTRKLWNEHIEDRVSATSNILAQIREIKMLGLASSMSKHLGKLHDKEVKVSLTDRQILCINFGISAFAETVSPALVIAATLFWTRASQPMTTGRFFATLAVVNLVSRPLAAFLTSLSNWSGGFACLSRIQEYLVQPDTTDPRQYIQHRQDSTTASSAASNLRNRRRGQVTVPFLIQLQDAIISMDENADPILRNVTVCINPGEVTMVHGSVGCGKSTFLKALLGEMLLNNGSITLSSLSVAYAAQQHWLVKGTIRFNIIGNKPYDHVLYRKVVFICALNTDFQQLPDGDQTIVGNAGSNLSGGQKQRISLARALYFEADVTILDDPFSSLDKETSTLVRTRLLSDGHATAEGKSLIMTTSMQQHLIDAHAVLHISDSGYVKQVPLEEVDAGLEKLSRRTEPQYTPKIEPMGGLEELPNVKTASTKDADDDEQPSVPQRDWSLYAYYFSPAGSSRFVFFLIANSVASLAEQMPTIFVRIWLGKDPGDYRYYIGYALLCLSYPIATSFSALVYFYTINARAASGLHNRLAEATFGATFEFLMNEDAGSIVNRFSQDMAMASQRVAAFVLPTIFRGVSILIHVGIISAGASFAAPIIPLFLFLAIAVQQYYLRTSRQLRVQELDSSKNLVRHFTETAAGIEHIRAFRWQEEATQKFHNILSLTQRPVYFLYCIQQWLQGVLFLSTAFAAIAVVSLALNFPSTASGPSMGLALLSLIDFSDTLASFITSSVALETAFGAVSRIRSYSTSTPAEEHHGTSPAPPGWPSLGRVELRDVSAVYKPRNAAPFRPTSNLSVVVQPGETLGLVGRTGSGKSTVLLSILNLLDYSGIITIDGREIRSIPPDELRARITTITQNGIHLRGSVTFNLDPFDAKCRPTDYTMTDAMQENALRRVGLWDIIRRRGDLTTSMKDMKLSHGQKQLLQLARAILHKQATGSRVVLMDEGTASLDEDTERRINRLLDEEFGLCTRIIISHRTSTLAGADAVMTLKDGQATVARHIAITSR